MNCSTLATTIHRLAAMTVIGLALLLQGCRPQSECDTEKFCSCIMPEAGVYRVRYRDADGFEQTADRQTIPSGMLFVCECSEILGANLIARNLPPDCSQAADTLRTLSPPNQDFVNIPIDGVSDPDGDTVGIRIDRFEEDEHESGLFPGDLFPDFRTTSASTAQVRAERDPAGNGRVYRIFFTASDGQGAICQGERRVCVPLFLGNECVDDSRETDLAITGSDAPDPVNQGDLLTYTINVKENNVHGASNVTLTDTLPASVTFVSTEVDGNSQRCFESIGGVTCFLGDIPVLHSKTAKITVRAMMAGVITNTASVRALETEHNQSDNILVQTTTVNALADGGDASVSIGAAPNPVRNGSELTFTIVLQNAGPQAATGVGLTGFTFTGMEGRDITTTQGSCSVAASNLTCNIGTLANGNSATVTIKSFPFETGTLTKTVTVTSDRDPNSANNTASVNVTVNPP